MTGKHEKGSTRTRNVSPWRPCGSGIGAGPFHAAKTPPPEQRAPRSLRSDRVDQVGSVEKFRTWLTLGFQQVPDTAPSSPDTPLGHLQR